MSVEFPPALTEVGLKVAVAFLGRPEILKVTVCVPPEVTAVEIVLVFDECFPARVKLVGFAEIEKLFVTEVIVSDTVVE